MVFGAGWYSVVNPWVLVSQIRILDGVHTQMLCLVMGHLCYVLGHHSAAITSRECECVSPEVYGSRSDCICEPMSKSTRVTPSGVETAIKRPEWSQECAFTLLNSKSATGVIVCVSQTDSFFGDDVE